MEERARINGEASKAKRRVMTSREIEYAKEDLELLKEFHGEKLMIQCGSKRVWVPQMLAEDMLLKIEHYLTGMIYVEGLKLEVKTSEWIK